jgi:hypothetical protein
MIRDLTMADAGWFLALNNAAMPHVKALAPADPQAMLGLNTEGSLVRQIDSGAVLE